MIKIVKEEDATIVTNQKRTETTIADWLSRAMVAINSENSAISEYDSIIASNDIPDDVKATFEEIRNDEKDHLVILTTLVNNNTKKDLPNNGEKEGS